MIITENEYQEALKYMDAVKAAASFHLLDATNVAGIISRESAFGLTLSPPGPAGCGDYGHGRGLMQIDDRSHRDFISLNIWQDARLYIFEGCRILDQYRAFLKNKLSPWYDLVAAYIAAFNCGPGNVLKAARSKKNIDYYTTGKNYSKDVLDRANFFIDKGWN
jgi:hypothetical protein